MRTDCTTMAARQDHEGPGKRGHLDNKTHSCALDLLLDQGRWTGRPAQVETAFGDNRKQYLDRMLEDDGEISAMEMALLNREEVRQANPCADDLTISATEATVGRCGDGSWPHDLRQGQGQENGICSALLVLCDT